MISLGMDVLCSKSVTDPCPVNEAVLQHSTGLKQCKGAIEADCISSEFHISNMLAAACG